MDYYPDKNLAFFHIPKTGGTSVGRFLRRCYVKERKLGRERQIIGRSRHEPLQNKVQAFDGNFDDITILTTIRNPYAATVSLYFFARELHQGRGLPRWASELRIAAKVDFPDFAEWYVKNWPSYYDYLSIKHRIPKKIQFIKLENLVSEMDQFLNGKLGLGVDTTKIPHFHHTGMGEKYREYFTRSTYKLINKKQKFVFKKGFYQIEKE